MYALADLNKFYVNIIRSFRPELIGLPVIVLSNNDGCGICVSDECKALGIKMGQHYKSFAHLIKKHNIHIFSTTFPFIASMSLRVKSILRRFCPDIEDYSIDEVFLDFKGFTDEQAYNICKQIVALIQQGLGLPICIGLARTKTLAKTACKFAKKYPKYFGVCMIDNDEKREIALKLTDIGDVWGIGDEYEDWLLSEGVKTAYDLTKKPAAWIRKNMTVVGERLYLELKGQPCLPMELIPPPKKSITTSRSFGTLIDDMQTIGEAVTYYCNMAATKLRNQKSKAKKIYVGIETNPFQPQLPQRKDGIIITLPVATSSTIEISKYAKIGLKKIYVPGYDYKKAEVRLLDITPNEAIQLNMFDPVDIKKRIKEDILMETADNINMVNGRNTVYIAAQGDGVKWWIRQNYKVPCYTTRPKDFPIAY